MRINTKTSHTVLIFFFVPFSELLPKCCGFNRRDSGGATWQADDKGGKRGFLARVNVFMSRVFCVFSVNKKDFRPDKVLVFFFKSQG